MREEMTPEDIRAAEEAETGITVQMRVGHWKQVEILAFTDQHDELTERIQAAYDGKEDDDVVELTGLDGRTANLINEYHLDEEGRMATTNYPTYESPEERAVRGE